MERLPPTQNMMLCSRIKRAIYQAGIWLDAHQTIPSPEQCGMPGLKYQTLCSVQVEKGDNA